ncbi:hypothetical protein FZEAL_363 [Fusarium zealandicum]|uniref:C3H1-type domain-containing protein n=1 Tax=Fusarium zealandicum TaxID=1053134 RepID=A0A8H4UVH8_9HYPO|nr:hypothetical protein FZEAL_363 [Fusarium zealandicum]
MGDQSKSEGEKPRASRGSNDEPKAEKPPLPPPEEPPKGPPGGKPGFFSKAMQFAKDNPVTAVCIGTSAVVIAAPALVAGPALGAVGFGANGIAAGSAAAGIQSGIGSVAAPSLFATLQSAAAGGYGAAAVHGVVQGAGALLGAGGLFMGKKKPDKPDGDNGRGGHGSGDDRDKGNNAKFPDHHKDQGKRNKKKRKKNHCPQYQKRGFCTYGGACRYAHVPRGDSPSSPAVLDPMDHFFASYPGFHYVRYKPLYDEFYRMCREYKWDSAIRKDAKDDFRTALVEQFIAIYGTDENDLECWRLLCRTLGIGEPQTLQEAYDSVQAIHVNLVDLIESPRTGIPIKLFENLDALREYTSETGKIFPRQIARSAGLLQMLLREVLCEPRRGLEHKFKE